MIISMVSFTRKGDKLADKIRKALTEEKQQVETAKRPFEAPLDNWVKEAFGKSEGIIFIGAAGIAVRSIAPYLKSKYTDPAVVVIDDNAKYSISLLSGHIGGANMLANKVAAITGATPVVTTATDVNDCFSVDVFAKQHELSMMPDNFYKKISAALLQGEQITVQSDFPIQGIFPHQLVLSKEIKTKLQISFSLFAKEEKEHKTLYLIPKVLTIGIGCRKGTPCEKVEIAVKAALKQMSGAEEEALSTLLKSTAQIVSIDVKQKEMGICQFAERYTIPFHTFSAEQLQQVEGDFSHSDFVEQTVGVDNVCERAAVLASNHGSLRVRKMTCDGVTIAIAMSDWSVNFE